MSDEEKDVRIVEPWPLLRNVSDEECWEHMSDADIALLGMDREQWEKQFEGNPCDNPKKS